MGGCRVLRFWDLCETESPQAPLACGVMVYPTQALCACHKPLWRATAAFPQAHKWAFGVTPNPIILYTTCHIPPYSKTIRTSNTPRKRVGYSEMVMDTDPCPFTFTLPLALHLHLHLHLNLPLRRLPAPNPPPSRVAVHLALRIASTPNSSQYNYSYH